MISLRLSSFKYSNESSGIRIACPPRLNQIHNTPKNRQVVSSRGLEKYQGLLLFAVVNPALLRGDISPKVSMDIRRAMVKRHSNAVNDKRKKTSETREKKS